MVQEEALGTSQPTGPEPPRTTAHWRDTMLNVMSPSSPLHTHTHTHMYTYTCINIHIHIYTYTYAHTYTHTHFP